MKFLSLTLLLLSLWNTHCLSDEKKQYSSMEWLKKTFKNNKLVAFATNRTKQKINEFKNDSGSIQKVEKFGYGLLMGYSSGLCLKKVSKVAAVFVGGLFLIIQSLSYRGYVKVDHKLIRRDFERTFDFNDDGEVNQQDIKAFLTKIKEILSNGMAAEGGGFTTGFVMGLRG